MLCHTRVVSCQTSYMLLAAGYAVWLELSFIVFMFYKQPEPDIGLIIKGWAGQVTLSREFRNKPAETSSLQIHNIIAEREMETGSDQ